MWVSWIKTKKTKKCTIYSVPSYPSKIIHPSSHIALVYQSVCTKKLDGYIGCWLSVDAKLAIEQSKLGVHETLGLNNPWQGGAAALSAPKGQTILGTVFASTHLHQMPQSEVTGTDFVAHILCELRRARAHAMFL